jgi:hypothetical protein
MPCTLPLGEVSGVFMSVCASNQITPPGPPCAAARPPSEPTAIEWSPPRTSGSAPRLDDALDLAGELLAGRLDRVPVAAGRVALVERLGQAGVDVAAVGQGVAEGGHLLAQLRVADRGRAHVDAATARPEVERRADDGDAAGGIGTHGAQAYRGRDPKAGGVKPR